MLLNIFFDNMNAKLELVLIGLVIFAVYWFILRRYNSLGLRLAVLCFFLFIGSCTWLYKDEVKLKHTISTGEEHVATVLSKAKVGKNDNAVTVSYTNNAGKVITAQTSSYVSQEEWDKFEAGAPVTVLYVPGNEETFVQQSIMRFKSDKIFLYFFASFWLLLGVVVYFWLRKYKVGVDEKTGNEWVEKADGSVILDERTHEAYRIAKRGNMASKMIQSFAK